MHIIKEVNDKQAWEKFLAQIQDVSYPFFQSWHWGDVQKQLGHAVTRYGVYQGDNLEGVFLVVYVKAKRGYYLHVRHGPVIPNNNPDTLDAAVGFLKQLARKEHAAFVRISPLIKKDTGDVRFFLSRGFRNAPIHNMDAEICWILPLAMSEEELLAQMRKSHRYLIRKAMKMDIEVIRTNKISDIGHFTSIYKTLSVRKHFVQHRGIEEEFAILAKDNLAQLYLAKYDKQIISAALIVYVGNMAIYHHGASLDVYRDIPASYLIQWEAIKEAKRRNKAFYNFWGIAPTEDKTHPWYGLSLFKTGFGGRKEAFMHAQDLPLSLAYWKTYAIEVISRIRKGY